MNSCIQSKSPINSLIKLNVEYFSTPQGNCSLSHVNFEEEKKMGSLTFSNYWPKPVDKFFSSIENETMSDLFLLCPVYNDGGVQIGGTGTAKQGETLSEALLRESSEEFGCVPETLEGIEVIDGDRLWLMTSTEYFYNLNKVPDTTSKHLDNKKRKVAFFYWADMERWKNITFDMNMAQKDNIIGFIALPHQEVLRVVKLLRL